MFMSTGSNSRLARDPCPSFFFTLWQVSYGEGTAVVLYIVKETLEVAGNNLET